MLGKGVSHLVHLFIFAKKLAETQGTFGCPIPICSAVF